VFREKRTITLRGVNFELDRATLTAASIQILEPIADAVAADTSLRIEIAGHTDATGSRPHNLALSQARAEAVLELFRARGVASDRMIAHGYGPDEPAATNRTAAGRATNRRTELRRLDHPPPPDQFTVEVARLTTRTAADRLLGRLTAAGFDARVVDQRGVLVLRVGRTATRRDAGALLRRLRAARFGGAVTIAEPASR